MAEERAAPERRHLGLGLNEQMTAKISEKEYRILPWYSNGRSIGPCSYFVYKDEDSTVTPGTSVRLSQSGSQNGFQLAEASFKLEPIPSAEELSNRPLDLESPEFGWFRELRDELKPTAQSDRPWVVVLMGCPGSGKTWFLKKWKTGAVSRGPRLLRTAAWWYGAPRCGRKGAIWEYVFQTAG